MSAVAVREATPAPRSESIASTLFRRESDRTTQTLVQGIVAAMDRYAARERK